MPDKLLEPVVILRGDEIAIVGMALSICTGMVEANRPSGDGKKGLEEHNRMNIRSFVNESLKNVQMVNGIMLKCSAATQGNPNWEVHPGDEMTKLLWESKNVRNDSTGSAE